MQVGDLIRFRYTGIKAKITEDYLDGSYSVWLIDDREESIAFADDIVLEKDFRSIEKSPLAKEKPKEKIKKLSTEEMFYSKEEIEHKKLHSLQKPLGIGHQEKKPKQEQAENSEKSGFIAPKIQVQAPQDSGLWLAFVESAPEEYSIYLVNDSWYSIRFEYRLYLEQREEQALRQTIAPHDFFPIGSLLHAQLNDKPQIDILCPGLQLSESIKIKYKNWVKPPVEIPLIGLICRGRLLFGTQHIARQQQTPPAENIDLKNYTHQAVKEKAKKQVVARFYNKYDINRLAHFEKEIDLHIDQLVDDHKELDRSEIFELQLLALQQYLQQAIELGVREVIVIHGIGEGKLQKAVAEYLRQQKQMGQIVDFRNEYIEGYGFGATRVRVTK